MHQDIIDITDLLTDESFISYCKGTSAQDIAKWENYISQYPEKNELIESAREQYLMLFNVLAASDKEEEVMRLKNRLDQKDVTPVVNMDDWKGRKNRKGIQKWLKWAGIAAAILPLTFFIAQYFFSPDNTGSKTYITIFGERKEIQLPDGSFVNLNAGSEIKINNGFGVTNRNIYLKGEAFFDVKHNAKTPFIVHTPAMEVKALGTAFDVRAYDGDMITETSLIRGLVEVTLKENGNQIVLLHPNHKIAWEHHDVTVEKVKPDLPVKSVSSDIKEGAPVELKLSDRGEIKEIAWKENKLIFDNDTFSDIASLLTRWYGARIEFKDDDIRNYRFTGEFEKEDLRTVLAFMKESRAFNFTIDTGETVVVTLSK